MDAEHPESFSTNIKFFFRCTHRLLEHCSETEKSKKHRDIRKCLCPFRTILPSLHSCVLQLHTQLPVVTGFTGFICQSVFLAHAMSSDRGLWPVRCSISRSIRLQKPSWSSG
ncbi:hypothetical protein CHARACLAT_015351 [Characodon lateralis]|uniref:Uncharacterized protein n=1 Tax=Characodon lateralis TaxID=208331 RepID=A0ABU7EJB1_9TELE|nr:hypothetical protein [Characodon lateralis]